MTVPTRTYHQLRVYQLRIAAMLGDPECNGDLLSLGIALLDYAILDQFAPEPEPDPDVVKLPQRGRRRPRRPAQMWSYYAERAWGEKYGAWKIKDVLKKDIRRYDAIADAESGATWSQCGAPMIRREGPCLRSASIRGMVTDPYTGRKQWVAGCLRHKPWFQEQVRANRAAMGEVEEIAIPAANAGGVLARHIPEIDWEQTWKNLDATWTPPPEGDDEPAETRTKPLLRLVLGGA